MSFHNRYFRGLGCEPVTLCSMVFLKSHLGTRSLLPVTSEFFMVCRWKNEQQASC